MDYADRVLCKIAGKGWLSTREVGLSVGHLNELYEAHRVERRKGPKGGRWGYLWRVFTDDLIVFGRVP